MLRRGGLAIRKPDKRMAAEQKTRIGRAKTS
jgi:hypothetical protein